ncbi:MAG: ABC transporter ATP-binding protein [Desulfobacterales bacterium]|nr:ABC transporter ATP-binding protein [Desulfobacterales bacterium]
MKIIPLALAAVLKNFSPLKQYFIQNQWTLLLGLMSLLVVDCLQLIIPRVIKKAVDLLTTQTATSNLLFQQGMIILGIALLIAVFRYVWRHLILGHSKMVEVDLRNRMYRRLQTLSLSFYQRTKTGDLMARSINDLNAVRMAAGMGLVALTDGIVLGMAAIAFMMLINVKLTLISLIPAPFIVLFTWFITRRMSRGYEKVQGTFGDLTERVREAFAGIRVIKAYNREDWEYQRIKEDGRRYISVNMGLAKILALFFPMMAIFTNTGLAIVIWLGGGLTILGDITIGEFVAFTGYLNLLTWPMMAMGWVTSLIQRGSASMRRINNILDEVPEIKGPGKPANISWIKGEIEIKDLAIRYPGQPDYTLKNINLAMDAGETVAIAGRVGTGKTTLLNMIPRLLDAQAGTVFVDGRDIRQIPLETLRGSIGFVTQEVFIFSDTIRNNALLGRDNISQKDLEAALDAAQFLEEIMTFEKGLDTLLGERGITLSGGQRQRLTIARALLMDPPVLILDDALSMVDTRTEERILTRILEYRQDRTNLIVSHRISTINRADRIIVLEGGEIVEQGTHAHLLEQGGLYAMLYEKQLLVEELGVDQAC